MVIFISDVVLEARKDEASTACLGPVVLGALKQLLCAYILKLTSLLDFVVASDYIGGHEGPTGTASTLINHWRDIICPVLRAFGVALEFLHLSVRFVELSIVECQAVWVESVVGAEGAGLFHVGIGLSLML